MGLIASGKAQIAKLPKGLSLRQFLFITFGGAVKKEYYLL